MNENDLYALKYATYLILNTNGSELQVWVRAVDDPDYVQLTDPAVIRYVAIAAENVGSTILNGAREHMIRVYQSILDEAGDSIKSASMVCKILEP